jgi:uncharacterized membrane protein YhaH (DUF805 family)
MWASLSPYFRRVLWTSGRSSRLEWWLVHLGGMAAFAINDSIFTLSTYQLDPLGTIHIRHGLWWYTNALLLWISFASIVRRLHDRNKSGWWVLLYAVPIVGWAWSFIECGFLPPRDQNNRFDPAPDTSHLTVQRSGRLRPLKTAGVAIGVLVAFAIITVLATARLRISEVETNQDLPVFREVLP